MYFRAMSSTKQQLTKIMRETIVTKYIKKRYLQTQTANLHFYPIYFKSIVQISSLHLLVSAFVPVKQYPCPFFLLKISVNSVKIVSKMQEQLKTLKVSY